MLTVSQTVLSVSKSATAMKEARWTIQHPGPMMRDADLSRRQRHRKRDRDRQIETEMEEETYTQRDRKRHRQTDKEREIETGRGWQRQSGVRMCMLLSSGPAAH